MENSLAIQLWSLRGECASDPAAALRRVPSLGFDSIELAGTYGLTLEEWKQLLEETGLTIVAAHIGIDSLEADWGLHSLFHRSLGNTALIVPETKEPFRNPEGYHDMARRLTQLGRRAKRDGFTLGYHNHAFDISPLSDGSRGIDILMREVEPELLSFEIDTYWVERGGLDAWQFIQQHTARISHIHAKEIRKQDNADVPAGQGDVDFKQIVPFARKQSWPIVVEYEGSNPTEIVAQSAGYLRQL
jgi:sugar phosphate isomerase/epimerase